MIDNKIYIISYTVMLRKKKYPYKTNKKRRCFKIKGKVNVVYWSGDSMDYKEDEGYIISNKSHNVINYIYVTDFV